MKKKKLINEQDQQKTAMLGAICGDVIGSVYEWDNIDFMLDPEELVDPDARFTDDTVMTCAVAYGLKEGLSKVGEDWMSVPEQEEILVEEVKNAIVKYGLKYPNVGYGGRFKKWLRSEDHEPYNSWGNGSGMRASYAGWVATSLEEAERLAEISAKVTHNHPEGIDGAKAIAGSIFLLRKGESKAKIREYAENFYDLNFTLKKIRKHYTFDSSCIGSVPQAIEAFLENDNFADVIAAAISIGGDSDTLAAMAGSLAEVIYPIPQAIRKEVINRLDKFLLNTVIESVDFLYNH